MEEMYGLISLDLKKQINAYELIARLTDGSKFQEFKAEYGKSLVTGFAHIMGFQVGLIANNSFLTSESALKGAHFIELCTHREVPIIFLQNITGFIVGKKHEHSGIARSGAKLIHAVANASVPKITLVFWLVLMVLETMPWQAVLTIPTSCLCGQMQKFRWMGGRTGCKCVKYNRK